MKDRGWKTKDQVGHRRVEDEAWGGEDARKMSRACRDLGLDFPCRFAEPS